MVFPYAADVPARAHVQSRSASQFHAVVKMTGRGDNPARCVDLVFIVKLRGVDDMRERALREFEAVFEQASIPVLDIDEVQIARVSLVLKGTAFASSVAKLGAYFQSNRNANVTVHWHGDAKPAAGPADQPGFDVLEQPFKSTAELVGQISIARSQLVILAEHEDIDRRFVNFDDLVVGVKPPVMVVRQEIDDVSRVFDRVLHSLSGNFRQTENFAYSFSLVRDKGLVHLLHVIDDNEVADVREVLEGQSALDDVEREALIERLTRVGERYLKAVVASRRERPFDVTYLLGVGDVLTAVRNELSRGDYGLLIVGRHEEGHSHVEAVDYQLMHEVSQVPVLAL